ncbi:MAG: glycosyltransferase family 4 protein [Gammaproteobacteria bacterium]|nr:glycosyltransferase family 4 protein [Gammaproteobacteria bacterium]
MREVEAPSQADVLLPIAADKIVAARWYSTHLGSIRASFHNQLQVRKALRRIKLEHPDEAVVLVIPGPNAVMAWLSFWLRRDHRIAIIVRGNSYKTVQHMYRGKLIGPFVKLLSAFFNARMRALQARGASVFCFGEDLAGIYGKNGVVESISPLISADVIRSNMPRPVADHARCPILLYVGRWSAEKGVIELLDAALELKRREVSFELRYVGHGPLSSALATRIAEDGLADQVKLVGQLQPGKPIYREMDHADLLILPSKTEGVPRVIAEALARGTRVVATRVGGIERAFADTIHYFNGCSPLAMAEDLQTLLDNKEQETISSAQLPQTLQACTFEDNLRRIESALLALSVK